MMEASSSLSSFGPLAGIGALVLTLVGIAGLVVAYYRVSLAKATIDTLKESNAALTERVDTQRDDIADCKAENERLTAEVKNLREYVSGTEAIKDLKSTIEQNHTELMNRLTHRPPRRDE